MRARESGFTLLELLVTLVVIAILAVVVLPTFMGEMRKARASSEVRPLFNDMRVRLEEYLQERGVYPPTAGESTWNPAGAPSTTRVPLDLTMAEWLPLRLNVSGESTVYCRYTFATGLANIGTNIGPQASGAFGFTAPSADWYYLLAKCDMDGDPSTLSWYFASSVDPQPKPLNEGR